MQIYISVDLNIKTSLIMFFGFRAQEEMHAGITKWKKNVPVMKQLSSASLLVLSLFSHFKKSSSLPSVQYLIPQNNTILRSRKKALCEFFNLHDRIISVL